MYIYNWFQLQTVENVRLVLGKRLKIEGEQLVGNQLLMGVTLYNDIGRIVCLHILTKIK